MGVFDEIYRNNAWKGKDSVSGPSSNLKRTQTLRAELPRVLAEHGITRMLDAPCGDFFWMQTLAPELPVQLHGGDIVPELIAQNRSRYRFDNVVFSVLDLRVDPLPEADLLFCRDCLFHLSYQDIAKVLQNWMRSDCRYLMTTSHINRTGFANSDIETGGWRWFDLFAAPFRFPETHLEAVLDGGGDRHMFLWDKSALAPAIEAFVARLAQRS